MNSGKYQLQTDGISKNDGAIWNKSGTRITYRSTKQNNKDFYLYSRFYFCFILTYKALFQPLKLLMLLQLVFSQERGLGHLLNGLSTIDLSLLQTTYLRVILNC